MKRDPDVLRSVRFLNEYTCLEIVEMPGREQVQLVMTGGPPKARDELIVTLTADQWRQLQALDFVEEQPEQASTLTQGDEDGSVH